MEITSTATLFNENLLTLITLINESLAKENFIPPYPGDIVEPKRPANDKTYQVILRNSTGLSRLELLIIP